MMVKRAIFAVSVVSSCLTVLLSGFLAAALQNWFGVSDLRFLVLWFLPVSLVAAVSAAYLSRKLVRWSFLVRYILGISLGICIGFLWTFCVARLLGPWWGAVSLPALMCWMAGGASGVAGGLVLGPGSSTRLRLGGTVGLLAIAGAGVVLSGPLATQLSHDQTLTVRFLKWTAGTEPLTIETERVEGISGLDDLSGAEVALLRAALPTGQLLVVWRGSRHGRGPAASALIVVKEPVKTSVTFQQPDRTAAVYLQEGNSSNCNRFSIDALSRVQRWGGRSSSIQRVPALSQAAA